MTVAVSTAQNPAYRLVAIFDRALGTGLYLFLSNETVLYSIPLYHFELRYLGLCHSATGRDHTVDTLKTSGKRASSGG